MNISDLELFAIELPSRDKGVRSLVVRVATDNGWEGWGETRMRRRAAELPARRKALLSVLAGREVYDVESMLGLDALADRGVACAIEMALWDVIARSARLPLCHLLGGGYRRSVPISVCLPAGTPETVAEAARTFAAQAITSQILGTSGSIENDLMQIRAVRQSCPDRLQLRLDAAARFDWQRALELCAELEPGSVQFVLDPLAGDMGRLAMLNAQVRVPLGAHESIQRPADIVRLARAEACSFVVVDPVRVGGLARARQCALVAEAAALSPILRIEETSGLAVAATLQLAAATPCVISGLECSYPNLHDDILREPLAIVDGMLSVPLGTGLGVEVDREKIDRYAVES